MVDESITDEQKDLGFYLTWSSRHGKYRYEPLKVVVLI